MTKEFQKRMKLFYKLLGCGVEKEKDAQTLTADYLIDIPGISVVEIKELLKLKEVIRDKRLFAYFAEGARIMDEGPVKIKKNHFEKEEKADYGYAADERIRGTDAGLADGQT